MEITNFMKHKAAKKLMSDIKFMVNTILQMHMHILRCIIFKLGLERT